MDQHLSDCKCSCGWCRTNVLHPSGSVLPCIFQTSSCSGTWCRVRFTPLPLHFHLFVFLFLFEMSSKCLSSPGMEQQVMISMFTFYHNNIFTRPWTNPAISDSRGCREPRIIKKNSPCSLYSEMLRWFLLGAATCKAVQSSVGRTGLWSPYFTHPAVTCTLEQHN